MRLPLFTRRSLLSLAVLAVVGAMAAGPAAAQMKAKDIELRLTAPRAKDAPPNGVDLDVQFAFDSADLLPQGVAQLDELAMALRSNRLLEARVGIFGHTDAQGAPDYNQMLSERRAESVVRYLITRHGLAYDRLRSAGYGPTRLKYPGQPYAAENRRVEVRLMD